MLVLKVNVEVRRFHNINHNTTMMLANDSKFASSWDIEQVLNKE